MKAFLQNSLTAVFGLVIAASAARAEAYRLPHDAISLSNLEGSIVAVSPLCPEGVTCITNGTVIDLKFVMQGCMDELGPVTYRTEQVGRTLKIYINAINVHTEESTHVACFTAPIAEHQITLIAQYGEVEAYFLGFDGPAVTAPTTH